MYISIEVFDQYTVQSTGGGQFNIVTAKKAESTTSQQVKPININIIIHVSIIIHVN